MKPTKLGELASVTDGECLGDASVAVSGVTHDTRGAEPGNLYVAIRGDRHDGHAFLSAAAEAGCAAALVDRAHALDEAVVRRFSGGVIRVADTVAALGAMGAHVRGCFAGKVIGVTGTVGKTTVKRMIDHVLSTRFAGYASIKSFNNAIGVPLTLLAADPKADYVVCELGTNAPGEIRSLTEIVRPDIAVINAVGPGHLQGLGTVEGVAAEKATILAFLKGHGTAVVRADMPELTRAVEPYQVEPLWFGDAYGASVRLTGWQAEGLTQRYEVNGRLWGTLRLPGRHNAINALAALAVGEQFGISLAEGVEALASFLPPAMRGEVQQVGPVTIVNDAYNANPVSMAAAIDLLGRLPASRHVLVAGDMRELGPTCEQHHRQIGRLVAVNGVDLLITVGALGRTIAAAAIEAGFDGPRTRSYETADDAAASVEQWLAPGDAVVVKASRAVGAERIAERVAECAARFQAGARASTGATAPMAGDLR